MLCLSLSPTPREPAVNMMQLLAMDYQKEWLEEREKKNLERKRLVSKISGTSFQSGLCLQLDKFFY